jgi:hypothetical protein
LEKLKQPKAGFHAFRRYRLTWLRKNRVHADLERFWMGHEMRPLETAIARERRWRIRSEQTETVGLDFALRPQITNAVRSVRKNEARPEVKNAA